MVGLLKQHCHQKWNPGVSISKHIFVQYLAHILTSVTSFLHALDGKSWELSTVMLSRWEGYNKHDGGEDSSIFVLKTLHLTPHSIWWIPPFPPIYFQPCHLHQECIMGTKSLQETRAYFSSLVEFHLGQEKNTRINTHTHNTLLNNAVGESSSKPIQCTFEINISLPLGQLVKELTNLNRFPQHIV